MTKLVMKSTPPYANYEQTDTYGSWRDMSNLGLRQAILEKNPKTTQKQLPKDLRGETKAYYYPK